MAEEKKSPEEDTDHPGIRPEMKEDWLKYVKDAIENDPGDERNYALSILKQVSTLIRALSTGLAPIEVLKLVEAGTSFVQMPMILQSVMAFSVRGDEFRLWWNQWHDRVCPTDVTDIKFEDMTVDQRKVWNARQRPVFNPWQVNINGKVAQLTGAFDPGEPITKTPKYLESVNALYKKMRETESAAA